MIPIYRAKKIDSDEWVEGFYVYKKGARGYENHSISYNKSVKRQSIICDTTIDPNTLAIHFPNMIDKNGKKIFASLSEDGLGGDIVKSMALANDHNQRGATHKATVKLINGNVYYEGATLYPFNVIHIIEVVGIHKGE